MRMLSVDEVAERIEMANGALVVTHDTYEMETDLHNVVRELTIRGIERSELELLLDALWTDRYEIQSSESEELAHEVALEESG